MALKKFGPNDLIVNTIRARPKFEFFVYDATVYYNNTPPQSASHRVGGLGEHASSPFAHNVLGVPAGYTNLYEYNIDRQYVDSDRIIDARKARGGTSGTGQSWQAAFNVNPIFSL